MNGAMCSYTRKYSSVKNRPTTAKLEKPLKNQQKSAATTATTTPKKFRKPSLPFRDYDAVRRNSMNVVSREDVALDAFLSRHRPLFLMDLKGEGSSRMGANASPWFQSANGTELDSEMMKNVPEDVVDRLKPFQEQKAMEEEEFETDPLLTDSFAQQLEKTLNFKIKGMEIVMPAGTSASLVLVKNQNETEKYHISTKDQTVEQEQDNYVQSPVSDSFLRQNTMQLTSVMRKRRIKMNRHKYKKRRKAQQAMRRKLNK